MTIVGLAALGLTALRNPTLRVVMLSHAVVSLLVFTAAVGALTDPRRVACIGFATFTGGILILGPGYLNIRQPPGLALNLGYVLFGDHWDDWVTFTIHPESYEIINDLVTLAVGLVGGLVALALRPRDRMEALAGRGTP
jgi:hypothetical protein